MADRARKRVVVVSGGAAGIGAAIAEAIGRTGAFVVTVDPMVSLDGSTRLETAEKTTVERIVAAGGQARASDVSITDADAVGDLFTGLVSEFGAIDAVVNAAGISRPTDFATGADEDWAAVINVHLGGYLNVLANALPLMSEAGHGQILGVTSGAGWRAANAGAYGCAKRAVAALTWQIARVLPPGVTVNALSPIAATRMVTAALNRRNRPGSASGGVSLNSMPSPDDLGPVGAYLASEEFSWCNGQVIFSNGSEIAPIAGPRLLELMRTHDVTSLSYALDVVVPVAFASAESAQATNGAGNPRFGAIFDERHDPVPAPQVASCLVVADDPDWGAQVAAALAANAAS